MTEPAEWTVAFAKGVNAHLDDAGLGAWREDGPAYAADETAIAYLHMPPGPDRAIVTAVYPVDRTPTSEDIVVGLQVRCRAPGSTLAAQGLADRVDDALLGLAMAELGGVAVSQITYRPGEQPGAVVGFDANDRAEVMTTYYVYARRVSPHYI